MEEITIIWQGNAHQGFGLKDYSKIILKDNGKLLEMFNSKEELQVIYSGVTYRGLIKNLVLGEEAIFHINGIVDCQEWTSHAF